MKDAAIVRSDAEKETVVAVGDSCFCLSRQSLPAPVMAGWYLAALLDITEAVTTTAPPFIYAVDRSSVRRLM